MKPKQSACDTLHKSLVVLQLCLQDCMKGSAWQRNPYIRSSTTKKKLNALHQAIEQVIRHSLTCSAQYAKANKEIALLHAYHNASAFLYEFSDGIKKEEYNHRILVKEERVCVQFSRLQSIGAQFTQSLRDI